MIRVILTFIFLLKISCLQKQKEKTLVRELPQQSQPKIELKISQSSIDDIGSAKNFSKDTLIILNKKLAQKLDNRFTQYTKEEATRLVRDNQGHLIFATEEKPTSYSLTEKKDWNWNAMALIAAAVAGTVIAGGLIYIKQPLPQSQLRHKTSVSKPSQMSDAFEVNHLKENTIPSPQKKMEIQNHLVENTIPSPQKKMEIQNHLVKKIKEDEIVVARQDLSHDPWQYDKKMFENDTWDTWEDSRKKHSDEPWQYDKNWDNDIFDVEAYWEM